MGYKIPPKATSGVLIINSVDMTEHARYVDIPEPSENVIDLGSWTDPTANEIADGEQGVSVEWLNDFADKATGSDGCYDKLLSLADGSEHDWEFQPFGTGSAFPKWSWKARVRRPPLGRFAAQDSVIVEQRYGINTLAYTKSDAT